MSTYVVQGLAYYATHPRLWLASLCPLLLTLVVALLSVILVPTLTLYPQADALDDAGVPSWLAWLLAILLVILEIFLVTFIYSLVVLPCFMDGVFETVLTAKGYGDLVTDESRHASCMRTCGICCRVSVLMRIGLLLITLPLNLIPFVGTAVFLWCNGFLLGWEYHLYYFELRGYTFAEQKEITQARHTQYMSFGMQALFFEMIPGVGPLFLFTNTVGAALFAADIERELRADEGQGHAASSAPAGYQVV